MIDAPVQALDAELAVLGSMLIEHSAARRAVLHLDPEDFYQESHRIVFKAINQLLDDGASDIDLIVVGQYLKINRFAAGMEVAKDVVTQTFKEKGF